MLKRSMVAVVRVMDRYCQESGEWCQHEGDIVLTSRGLFLCNVDHENAADDSVMQVGELFSKCCTSKRIILQRALACSKSKNWL